MGEVAQLMACYTNGMSDTSLYQQDHLPVTDKPWWKAKSIAALALAVFLLLVALLTSSILFGVMRDNQQSDHDADSATPTPGATLTPTPTTSPIPSVTPTSSPAPTSIPISVYFSKHPDSDNDFTKVVAVERTSTTIGVATAAMQQLLAGPTSEESSQGLFSEWQLDGESTCGALGFSLTIEGTRAKVELCRNFVSDGAGDDARAKAEADATLTQFDNISEAVYVTKDGHCLFDQSGQDVCLK
jgi:hypothetical protein